MLIRTRACPVLIIIDAGAQLASEFGRKHLDLILLISGIIYDVIVEPPSVGSMTDEHGHQRPVAFLAYR